MNQNKIGREYVPLLDIRNPYKANLFLSLIGN